ncbi:uncharacterized protein LOC122072585 [Macadamia integrifolia]|uniref:uncharacterized protein LOC122072585 n=1 Tax=Macadamia integrifolia TaxID=60698 RepID=UPI001C4ECD3D|nr:uncharacterized protein LOC122072585 [Macadamia integrifolia]
MGSLELELEEDELVQMVHDFIESKSPSSPSLSLFFLGESRGLTINQHHTSLTLQEILGDVEDFEAEILEKVLKYLRKGNTARKTTSLKKLLTMKLRLDGYDASLCRTSWVSTFNCPGGDYEYIDIMMKEDKGGPGRLIVDIDFKSQFELARPTSSYTQLTDTLPSIFVGSETKLNKVISILCTAAKQSLEERGLHVPPWRKTNYMQSKWLSEYRKVCLPPCIKSNRESSRNSDEGSSTGGSHGTSQFNKWAPPAPMVKPKRRGLGSGSGLSSQFSNLSINCC